MTRERVCVCAFLFMWMCGSMAGTGSESRCNNMGGAVENIRAAKYNKRRSPGITGELLSLTSLCQSTRGKLLKPPVQSCNTDTIRPELKSGPAIWLGNPPFCNPSTHDGSRRNRFFCAESPSNPRLWSSYHKTPANRKQLKQAIIH